MLKVAWAGDDESLHDAEALELWDGNGAVRVLRADPARRAQLLERAVPGTDISQLDDDAATAIAVDVASKLWLPAGAPFRPVEPEVRRWLDPPNGKGASSFRSRASSSRRSAPARTGSCTATSTTTTSFATASASSPSTRSRTSPTASTTLPSFLWNPMDYRMDDSAETERRIAAFVGAGLDDFRIRAWTVIRGAYLRPEPEYVEPLRSLLG